MSKPALAAAALPKKSTEIKKEDKAEAKEEKKEAKEEKKEDKKEIKEEKKEEKEEKKARKSRSASRKRNSIFGSIGFGKKEDKVEPKEETPVAATEETAVSSHILESQSSHANRIIHRLLLRPPPQSRLPLLLRTPQLPLLKRHQLLRQSRPSLLLRSATASSETFNPDLLQRRRRQRRPHPLSQPRMLSQSLRLPQ